MNNYKKNIEEVFPDVVETTLSGIKNVNYNGLIEILIEAIKNLNEKMK